jgi:hypothetical protein
MCYPNLKKFVHIQFPSFYIHYFDITNLFSIIQTSVVVIVANVHAKLHTLFLPL